MSEPEKKEYNVKFFEKYVEDRLKQISPNYKRSSIRKFDDVVVFNFFFTTRNPFIELIDIDNCAEGLTNDDDLVYERGFTVLNEEKHKWKGDAEVTSKIKITFIPKHNGVSFVKEDFDKE